MRSIHRSQHRSWQRSWQRIHGFTYLGLLFWIALSGVVLAGLGQMWSQDARRAREAELAFRGAAYARALGVYAADHNGQFPAALDDLLEDRRTGQLKRYLRRRYTDPITGSADWGLVRNADGRIQAVHSTSSRPVLRQDVEAATYREWLFQAEPPGAAASAAAPDGSLAGSPAGSPAASAASSPTAAPQPVLPTGPLPVLRR